MLCVVLCSFCAEVLCGANFPPTRAGAQVESTRRSRTHSLLPPRQWRRVAQGNFYLKDVVERIRLRLDADDDDFFRKLRHLSDSLPNNLVNPTVLLIGVDETGTTHHPRR